MELPSRAFYIAPATADRGYKRRLLLVVANAVSYMPMPWPSNSIEAMDSGRPLRLASLERPSGYARSASTFKGLPCRLAA